MSGEFEDGSLGYGSFGESNEFDGEGRPDLYGSHDEFDDFFSRADEGSTIREQTRDERFGLSEFVWEDPPTITGIPANSIRRTIKPRTGKDGVGGIESILGPESRHKKSGDGRKPGDVSNPKRNAPRSRIPGLPTTGRVNRDGHSNPSGRSSKGLGIGDIVRSAESEISAIVDTPRVNHSKTDIQERLRQAGKIRLVRGLNSVDQVAPQFYESVQFHGAVSGMKFNASGDLILTTIIPAKDRYEAMKLTDMMKIVLLFEAKRKSPFLSITPSDSISDSQDVNTEKVIDNG